MSGMAVRIALGAACVGVIAAPPVVADLVPAEGVTLNRTHVLFTWDEVPGAVRYHLQVAESAGGGDPFEGPLAVDTMATRPWYVVTCGLQWATDYAWRTWVDEPGEDVHHFSTRALPEDLPRVVLEADDPERYQPGITLFNIFNDLTGGDNVTAAVDENGEWIWVQEWPTELNDIRLLPNGNLLLVISGHAAEATLDSEYVWRSPPGTVVHHEAFPMPNGNVLAVTTLVEDIEQNGEWWQWRGDEIVEFDRDGNKVWTWNLFDHLSLDDYDQYLYDTFDPDEDRPFAWTHTNGCVYDPKDDAVYISIRNVSRIVKVDHATGDLIWSMGFRMPSGEADFGDDLFSFQHAPQVLPNGNIVLFDNGCRRGHSYGVPDNPYSKAIEIAFDWDEPEPASIVWEYVITDYIYARGDADRLPNGNTLVAAGTEGRLIEVSPEGDVVWQMDLIDAQIYRSERELSLYTGEYRQGYESCSPPVGWFVPGWVWFSIPLVPRWSGDATDILGFDCSNRLFGWDDAAKNLKLYPFDFTALNVGPSYAAYLNVGEQYVPEYEGAQPESPFERALPAAGRSWVGVPGTQDVSGLDLSVTKGLETRTAAEDRAADPWLNWNWVYWDATAHDYRIMDPFGGGDDTALHPWWGYHVWSNTEDVTVVFP